MTPVTANEKAPGEPGAFSLLCFVFVRAYQMRPS
jgi:hypothetical protein